MMRRVEQKCADEEESQESQVIQRRKINQREQPPTKQSRDGSIKSKQSIYTNKLTKESNQRPVRADSLTATLTLAREGSTMPHWRRTDNSQKSLIEVGVDFRLVLLIVVPILRIPFAGLGPVLFVGIVTFVIDAGPLVSWLTAGVILFVVTVGGDIRIRPLAEEGWNAPMSTGHGSIVTTSRGPRR